MAQEYAFYLGSGVTLEQIPHIPNFMTGMIVGTALKEDADVKKPVSTERTHLIKQAIQTWNQSKPSNK